MNCPTIHVEEVDDIIASGGCVGDDLVEYRDPWDDRPLTDSNPALDEETRTG